MLSSIDEEHAPSARRVLEILAFSEVPVSLDEAAELLAIDLPSKSFNLEQRLLLPRQLLSICSTLVTVVEGHADMRRFNDHRKRFLELRLAHYSVQEYLVSERIRKSRAVFYALDTDSANLSLARSCFIYLNIPAFNIGYSSPRRLARYTEEYPFLQYAAQNFGTHLRKCESLLDTSDKGDIIAFFSTRRMPKGGTFGTFVSLLWRSLTSETYQKSTTPIYVAASYGLTDLLSTLIELGDEMGTVGSKGGRYHSSPLIQACYRGHMKSVQILLAAGANVDAENEAGETALHMALIYEHNEIRDLLVSNGAAIKSLSQSWDAVHKQYGASIPALRGTYGS